MKNGTPINFVGKKFGGSNQKKPGIKLEKLTTEQVTNLKNQIKADATTLGKSKVKDKILSSTGKVLKGIGKVIKPIGYAVGTKALFDAQALADEQGIELSNFDKLLALIRRSFSCYQQLQKKKRSRVCCSRESKRFSTNV